MPKYLELTIAGVYTITLAIVSLINIDDVPKLGVDYEDKIIHFFAYVILSILWINAIQYKINSSKILIVGIILIIYGTILEVLQSELTSFRDSNVYDAIANALGVIIVTVYNLFKNKTHVKKI